MGKPAATFCRSPALGPLDVSVVFNVSPEVQGHDVIGFPYTTLLMASV
jgi:hypothetical protein